jgi:hypothetical protein
MEMLIVIAIFSTVGSAITYAISYFYKANGYLLQETGAIDSARRGLATAFTTIREASYGDDGSYPLQSAATSSITFFADVDNDGSVEKIRLYVLDRTFYKTMTESAGNPPSYAGRTPATTTIATYVVATTSPIFRYYDSTGAELSSPVDVSQVESVSTALMVDLNPFRAPDVVTLREAATLRNLRQ